MKGFANCNVYFWITYITLFDTAFLYCAVQGSRAASRIQAELKEVSNSLPPGFVVKPNEYNIFEWKATMKGPENSPYAGGVFKLSINFPQNYPFSAPTVKFDTPIYHPNINEQGKICVDILKEQWSPVLQVFSILLSVSSLLTDPNANDPLNSDAGSLYLRDKAKFDKIATQWTKTYAKLEDNKI